MNDYRQLRMNRSKKNYDDRFTVYNNDRRQQSQGYYPSLIHYESQNYENRQQTAASFRFLAPPKNRKRPPYINSNLNRFSTQQQQQQQTTAKSSSQLKLEWKSSSLSSSTLSIHEQNSNDIVMKNDAAAIDDIHHDNVSNQRSYSPESLSMNGQQQQQATSLTYQNPELIPDILPPYSSSSSNCLKKSISSSTFDTSIISDSPFSIYDGDDYTMQNLNIQSISSKKFINIKKIVVNRQKN